MAELVVDLGLLESTAGALSMLMAEFSNASQIVGDYQGDPKLTLARQDFAGNWKVRATAPRRGTTPRPGATSTTRSVTTSRRGPGGRDDLDGH
jgi:hypothetical protein